MTEMQVQVMVYAEIVNYLLACRAAVCQSSTLEDDIFSAFMDKTSSIVGMSVNEDRSALCKFFTDWNREYIKLPHFSDFDDAMTAFEISDKLLDVIQEDCEKMTKTAMREGNMEVLEVVEQVYDLALRRTLLDD